MGGMGHLSNDQALAAAMACAEQSDLEHLVLLHLSRQCNDPHLVRQLYARRAPDLFGRLTLTSQRVPTPVLHVRGPGEIAQRSSGPGRQLNFLEALPGPA